MTSAVQVSSTCRQTTPWAARIVGVTQPARWQETSSALHWEDSASARIMSEVGCM